MRKYILSLLAFFAILLSAHAQVSTFAYPAVPDTLKNVEQRASYLTLHYWDNFDFADTLQLHDANNAEQGFVNYIDLISRFMSMRQKDIIQKTKENKTQEDKTECTYSQAIRQSIKFFCSKAFAQAPAKDKFESLISHYLENPKSPMRNDRTYLLFLQEMKTSSYFDETEKERINFQIKTRNKNLPGDKAIDFAFSDKEGKQHQLSDYKDKKVILYFYDPDCDNCHRISAWLDKQTIPADYTFLTIYADTRISDLYSLEAMPTIFLLDKGNVVVLKDCSPELLIHTINQK